MSGHNKFSQIKHQKASDDGKRSKMFSILGKQISVQSRLANGDMNSAGLRAMIEKARKANMPNDTIGRAVKKGIGSNETALEEVLYDAFGPGGVAMMISGITDSRNRTSNEIKNILSDHSGSLGTPGSASWAFPSARDDSGDIIYTPTTTIPLSPEDTTKLTELIEALENQDDVKSIATNANS